MMIELVDTPVTLGAMSALGQAVSIAHIAVYVFRTGDEGHRVSSTLVILEHHIIGRIDKCGRQNAPQERHHHQVKARS